MARSRWTLKGRLLLAPLLPEVQSEANVPTQRFGEAVPLAGVRVQVSGKQFAADPTWDEWGETITDEDGRFEVHHVKNQTKRRFRVRAMFKDDRLKIYPPNDSLLKTLGDLASVLVPGTAFRKLAQGLKVNLVEQLIEQTSRITYDVKWHTVFMHDTGDKVSGPNVDFQNLTLGEGAPGDRGAVVARRHAEIWYVAKRAMALLDGIGDVGFRTDRPIAFLHPHDNGALPDGWESSYANPHNDIVYLVQNGGTDHFNVSSILHEMMHLWAYQHVRKEEKLASYLLTHFDTHNGRHKHWVAWHEAFAEATSNEISRQLFGQRDTVFGRHDAQRRPYSRPRMQSQGILTAADLAEFEEGWLSAFNLLLCPDVAGLDMNVPGPFADNAPGMHGPVVAPRMDLADLLRAVANPGGRKDGDFPIDAMGIPAFFAWMDVPEFTVDHQTAYFRILDPQETLQPRALLPGPIGRLRPLDVVLP